jgi:hypothetical protein
MKGWSKMIEGKGQFMWVLSRCEGGDPMAIADEAQRAGLSHVLIKVADGPYAFNHEANISGIVLALHRLGIKVWGWQYIYGYRPIEEAKIGASRTISFDMDGFVVNAEREFKRLGMDAVARQYMRQIKEEFTIGFPIGLSSYRFPRYHMAFPWQTLRSYCDFDMPQVYWEGAHNPANQLEMSHAEFKRMTPQLPYVATGSAYTRGDWAATPEDIEYFMDNASTLGLSGVNFWEWGHTRKYLPDVWDAIADYEREEGDPPAPPPEPEPSGGLRLRCIQEGLNIRTGPNTAYTSIGRMSVGYVITPTNVGGPSGWVEFEYGDGQKAWANVTWWGDRNMEVVEE